MPNTAERSSILLLCLSKDSQTARPLFITANELRVLFSPFGLLSKIVIFSKKEVLKAFVEFQDVASATKALKALDKTSSKFFGKIRVFFSALQQLTLKHDVIDSWQVSSADSNEFFVLNRNHQLEVSGQNYCSQASVCDETQANLVEGSTLDSDSLAQFFKEEQMKSKVVLISNIPPEIDNVRKLFGLLSCFGYIVRLITMKNLNKAMVEYQTLEQADLALKAINTRPFEKFRIRASKSKYSHIDLKRSQSSENSQNFNEVMIPQPNQNVIGQFQTPKFPLISRSVQVKGTDGLLKAFNFVLLVRELATPISIEQIGEEGELHFRMEFADADQAMLIVASFNSKTLEGTAMTACFCA